MSCNDALLCEADRALLRLMQAVRGTGYSFTTVSPATHARNIARPGKDWARDLRDIFGWSRPFETAALPQHLLALMREAEVIAEAGQTGRSLVRLSTLGDALFAHSAYPTTETDSVFFGPDTYRFASVIRRYLLERRELIRRAVDIGCGAGPGGIIVAKHEPQAEVLLVDVNERALRLARVNATLAGAHNAVTCRSDLLSGTDGPFDLIVANPPYLVDPSERAYRHGGGALGAALSLAIIESAAVRLSPSGRLLLYTGSAIVGGRDRLREDAAKRLATIPGSWSYEELDPDVFGEELDTAAYANAERIAAVVLHFTKDD